LHEVIAAPVVAAGAAGYFAVFGNTRLALPTEATFVLVVGLVRLLT
jgi:hypothetical protein